MDGIGTFSKNITYLGELEHTDLFNGQEFRILESDDYANTFEAGLGNVVNIYVSDQIYDTSRLDGTTFGIQVMWGFRGYASGVHVNASGRVQRRGVVPWVSESDESNRIVANLWWMDSKIEFASARLIADGFQAGELGVNVYTFPLSTTMLNPTHTDATMELEVEYGNRNHVVPVVARGDFMKVFFWCSDDDWVGNEVIIPRPPPLPPIVRTDAVRVWAISGSDVAGSQRIGGGHG